MKIALADYTWPSSDSELEGQQENLDIIQYFQQKGHEIKAEIWNDAKVNWANYDIVIIKSPWDYHLQQEDFISWITRLESLGIQTLNSAEIIKWNSDKHYLQELQENGVNIIPTTFVEQNEEVDFDLIFDQFGVDKLVMKPCISAGAMNTIVIDRNTKAKWKSQAIAYLSQGAYMFQPFIEEIKNGEWSLLFFQGKYSHCALKTPKQGEFRVQEEYGGTITFPTPAPHILSEVEEIAKQYTQKCLYARIDGVIIDDRFALMELELIEPYLYLENDPQRMQSYYQAFEELVKV